jgi:hypothetical protein
MSFEASKYRYFKAGFEIVRRSMLELFNRFY